MNAFQEGNGFNELGHVESGNEAVETSFEKLSEQIDEAQHALGANTEYPDDTNHNRMSFGGKGFGDNIVTTAQEYNRMFLAQRGTMSPASKNEAEGMLKYLTDANELFQRAQKEPHEDRTIPQKGEIRTGEKNQAYYETFNEIESGTNELLLTTMVEKFNEQCAPGDRFDLQFPQAVEGNLAQKGFAILAEYARFMGHAQDYLEKSGTDPKALKAAEKALAYVPLYAGIEIQNGRAIEHNWDRMSNHVVNAASVTEFNQSIPKDARGQLVNWLPMWLRKQALFREQK